MFGVAFAVGCFSFSHSFHKFETLSQGDSQLLYLSPSLPLSPILSLCLFLTLFLGTLARRAIRLISFFGITLSVPSATLPTTETEIETEPDPVWRWGQEIAADIRPAHWCEMPLYIRLWLCVCVCASRVCISQLHVTT